MYSRFLLNCNRLCQISWLIDITALDDGIGRLANGAGQLDGGLSQLKDGSGSLTEGLNTIMTSTDTLADGAKKIADGNGDLYNGLTQLKDGADKLSDGASQLEDGAKTLNDGMDQFKTEAIDKLADIIENDVEEGLARFKAMTQASRSYASFSGKSEEMDGKVKFIFTTDGVEKKAN